VKRVLILVGLAALAACSTLGSVGGGGSIGNRINWHCDGGHSFTVSFTRNSALVSVNGRTYNLVHAQSGSGARYSNGSVEYWERVGQAQLTGTPGGPYANCRRR
jgi:membrane-bound inhibitor of C-type lysozyme